MSPGTGVREAARGIWRDVRPYLLRFRRGFVWGFGALAMKDLLGAALPPAMRSAIDALTNGRSLRVVFWLALLLTGLSALKGVFQYWMRVILIGISRDVEYDMRNDLFAHLVTLDGAFFGGMRTAIFWRAPPTT